MALSFLITVENLEQREIKTGVNNLKNKFRQEREIRVIQPDAGFDPEKPRPRDGTTFGIMQTLSIFWSVSEM